MAMNPPLMVRVSGTGVSVLVGSAEKSNKYYIVYTNNNREAYMIMNFVVTK